MRKKILSFALVALLTVSSVPLNVNAAEIPDASATSATADAENDTTEAATPTDAITELPDKPEVLTTATGDVAINETNFPDASFRNCVKENFDTNLDGILSESEILAVESIEVADRDINSLKGIEIFTNLTLLTCWSNNLSSIDVSKNTKLEYFDCSYNNITTLNVSKNTKLTDLSCSNNNLSSLDITKNTLLTLLHCSDNKLSSLDVSNNTKLTGLNCSKNKLSSLDITKNTLLTLLHCSDNKLSSLDVSNNTEITNLYCGNNSLSSFNTSKNTLLRLLDCNNNNLSSLDVSNNTELDYLNCNNNNISSLDVSNNTKLYSLYCNNNNLSSLDITNNTDLFSLYCNNNNLTSIDTSIISELGNVECFNNQYTIYVTSNKTFDLTTLPGKFEVSKTSNWNGGTVSGTTLKINENTTKVKYDYTCGNRTSTFTLNVVEKTTPSVDVSYRTHVQDYGWQNYVTNGQMSGTSGKSKRLEGININVTGNDNLGIQYTTHVQNYGWMPWCSNGEMSGTTGESKRLEAIKIQLTGADKDLYDVFYRVHAQNVGWLNWAKNGEPAGTAGYSYRLEGIQIQIVKKGESFNTNVENISSVRNEAFVSKSNSSTDVTGADTPYVMYQTHVQNEGWQAWKNNGQLAGTTGKSYRLEGINIKLSNKPYSGSILYTTHVQNYGWQGDLNNPLTWKKDGEMSGTSGESKRLEAICIKLTGEMEQHYDVYYRVHAQNFGWLGWAKNGAPSGTAGYSYRLESIQVVLVPKGAAAPSSNYGGINANRTEAYISK